MTILYVALDKTAAEVFSGAANPTISPDQTVRGIIDDVGGYVTLTPILGQQGRREPEVYSRIVTIDTKQPIIEALRKLHTIPGIRHAATELQKLVY